MACEAISEIPMDDIVHEIAPPETKNPQSSRTKTKTKTKTIPRYLRASEGSCHDLCKFGHKHSHSSQTDESPRVPLRTFIKKATRTAKQQRSLEDSKAKIPSVVVNHKAQSPKAKQSEARNRVSVSQKSENSDESENNVPEKTLYVIESTLESIASEEPPKAKLSRSPLSPKPSSLGKKVVIARKKEEEEEPKIPTKTKKQPLPQKAKPSIPASPKKIRFSGQRNKTLMSNPINNPKKISFGGLRNGTVMSNPINNPKKISFSGRRNWAVMSETKNNVGHKLKFRRGTVIEPKPENNNNANPPKRLTFWQVKQTTRESLPNPEPRVSFKRAVPRNQVSSSVGTKTGSKKREIVGKDNNGGQVGPEKVVLRHQNVEGKREIQSSLFNNVIEETASKLVESRKSKVKALVGAFETVIISLQDAKPA